MENNLEKELSDSMLKACEAKIGQVKKEFRAEITKITDRLVTVENRDNSNQCNGYSEPCKLNFIVRNMAVRSGENVKNRVNGMINTVCESATSALFRRSENKAETESLASLLQHVGLSEMLKKC